MDNWELGEREAEGLGIGRSEAEGWIIGNWASAKRRDWELVAVSPTLPLSHSPPLPSP
ncbi:hypothetical protein IQ269_27395, partial [Tychonema sp. LEGE 07199]|nr:hypothetical protein [Tychonema sp. LEGE 07199]